MKQEKSCGVIGYRIQGEALQILLIRHRHGGHWGFPKGHVEGSETEHETALRELLEETGMEATLYPGYREVNTYSPARGVSKQVVMFVGQLQSGAPRPQPAEVRTAVLVPYAQALTKLSYPADRQMLEKALPLMEKNA